MGDLLRDAIADAKKVQATAIANARQAILETFQPSVQRIISSKIAEEEGEDLDIDISFNGEEEGSEEPAVGFGGGEDVPPPVTDDGEEEMAPEEDDMELEALMREFEEEEMDSDLAEEEWEDSSDFSLDEENNDDGGAFTHAPPPESGKNSIGDLNEEEVNEILSMLGESADEFGDNELTEDEGYDDTLPERDLNTESRVAKLQRTVKRLQGELRESYQAITIMKKTINEVNLLNAKLMYSQKLIHKMDLTEDQKVKVLEAFDRANTVREVKSKYLDIMTLINKGKGSQKKKMTEGSASRSMRQPKPLNEAFNFAPRWQQLAGMKPLED